MTDHVRQAKAHLKEYYGEAEGERYMTRLAAGASAHALLAIHDLLADALASPETALRASESDAGPSEGSPEDPPAPERPREDDSVHICRGPEMVERERRPHGEVRWCFRCRERVGFEFVCKVPAEPSYWGPIAYIACAERGHVDGDLFPGREREWDL